MKPILVIDDDPHLSDLLVLHLEERGFTARTAASAAEGERLAREVQPSLIVLDVSLPDGSGLELLGTLRAACGAPVVIITAHDDMDTAILAMKSGAFDFVRKPLDVPALDAAIDRALEEQRAGEGTGYHLVGVEPVELRGGVLVGSSARMQLVFKEIGRVAASRAAVLVVGETGTGKELVARAIHDHTHADRPFVAVNCAAIVESLLESELFGHEKGAFTGAVGAKRGKCEIAEDGTLFLDEIGDLSLDLQAKLLRLLQEREFERVGGMQRLALRARVIAATHRDLEAKVRDGSFREDLHQRLQVVTISLPALRERREDVPQLVEHLLRRVNARLGRSVTKVPQAVMQELCERPWFGNVRELENALTRAVVMATGDVLLPETLSHAEPPHAALPAKPLAKAAPPVAAPLELSNAPALARPSDEAGPLVTIEEMERELIGRVVRFTGGHRARACDILGISRPTLRRKLRAYAIPAAAPDDEGDE